ncbi:MAG: hypothetical protein HEQ20_24650 [Aphanizomenon flos-aquae KM1D3_PB]|nr:hypothetical protein OA07_00495 [Aphanizomenon flos-aquae 2012/KM1/D3]QSV73366.1 MAG: hypothetical protein HEQ20_24650 [Aphanizomenon flos-aquae KM1D3_PB]
MARQKARGKRQEARVKRVWVILRFFTQFGFIVFTYLDIKRYISISTLIDSIVNNLGRKILFYKKD